MCVWVCAHACECSSGWWNNCDYDEATVAVNSLIFMWPPRPSLHTTHRVGVLSPSVTLQDDHHPCLPPTPAPHPPLCNGAEWAPQRRAADLPVRLPVTVQEMCFRGVSCRANNLPFITSRLCKKNSIKKDLINMVRWLITYVEIKEKTLKFRFTVSFTRQTNYRKKTWRNMLCNVYVTLHDDRALWEGKAEALYLRHKCKNGRKISISNYVHDN